MATQLAKHGSEAGYRAEISHGEACPRCRNAHRQFDKQYTKIGKRQGLKYTRYEVIDHLYRPGKARVTTVPDQRVPETYRPQPASEPARTDGEPMPSAGQASDMPGPEPTIGERLTAGLRNLASKHDQEYVETDEYPDYLTPIAPDAEPGDEEWSEIRDEEFVINAAGMKLIEENLGTYLSIVGMTAEMIDPYCGPILAENFDNIVNRWSKVIAHYPKAAKLFLDTKGGTIFAWIGALQATWPVLYAIYEHHLARTVKTQGTTVFRRGANGQMPDATMPPMTDTYQYSAV